MFADAGQWKHLSYCLSQLAYTEKGMKKLIELFKTYEHALSEDSVMDHFKNIINKVLIWSRLKDSNVALPLQLLFYDD